MNTVLVIDDDINIIKLIKLTFNKNNINIIKALDGTIALKILQKNYKKIDLIITDLMMPKMDGYSFILELKKNDLFKNIPVIMLTAKNKIDYKITGYSTGILKFLTKPFKVNELLEVSKKIMSNEFDKNLRIKFWKNKSVLFNFKLSEKVWDEVFNTLIQFNNEKIFYDYDKVRLESFFKDFYNLIKKCLGLNINIGYFLKVDNKVLCKILFNNKSVYETKKTQLIEISKKITAKYEIKDNAFIFEYLLMSPQKYVEFKFRNV